MCLDSGRFAYKMFRSHLRECMESSSPSPLFSQLAKQSHWKLSADCSIAHEHIRPVDLPVNTFSN